MSMISDIDPPRVAYRDPRGSLNTDLYRASIDHRAKKKSR